MRGEWILWTVGAIVTIAVINLVVNREQGAGPELSDGFSEADAQRLYRLEQAFGNFVAGINS